MPWLPLICAVSGALGAPLSSDPLPVQASATSVGGYPQSAEAQDPVELEDVIVAGRRGSARLAPEIEFGDVEIDSLGAYDIGEVLARIGENLGFDAPAIIIVNGRRAVNARDFLHFPPDALVRVEALPQQAGAIYGGDPTRRVLNIVLQPEFRSRDGLLKGSRPTAGGNSSLTVDARQSEILDNDTRQFGAQVSRDTALRAGERPSWSRDHPGRDGVTLRPAVDVASANFSVTRSLGDWSSSLNANAQTQGDRFVSMVGDQAVETRRTARNLTLAGGLGGDAMGWSVRFGLDGVVSDAVQKGIVDSRSHHLSMAADLAADRTLIDLPAGPLLANLSARYARSRTVAETGTTETPFSSEALDLRGNVAVPLSKFAPPSQDDSGVTWGDMSVTLGATLRELDDAGAGGQGLNGGLSWSPVRKLRFTGQWSRSTDSPTAQQRFDPVIYGAPRVVFDFLTGDSVEVLPVLGGNPDLRSQTAHRFSVSTSAGPFTSWRILGGVSFQRTRSTDGIGAVPGLTPAVEAAFPERFIRDAGGRLVSIDQRPINLHSTLVETLSSNLTFSIPFRGAASGARRVGSLQVGLNHTWRLENLITIRDGLPDMDRLAGDGGGTPRHQLAVRVDGRYGKWGLNAAAHWRSPSRTRRDLGRDGPDDVRLARFATIDLKLSYLVDVAAGREDEGSRRDGGIRLELEVDNLFDARPEARLGDGRPAPGYGRDDQDPLGRVVRLTATRRF